MSVSFETFSHCVSTRNASRPDREVEAARGRRIQQRAPRASGAETHLDVGPAHGLAALAPGRLGHRHLARAEAEKPPGGEPLARLEAHIGIHARQAALDRPPLARLRLLEGALALAHRDRETREPAPPLRIRADDAGEDLAVDAHGAHLGFALAVEAAHRRPAPGGKARTGAAAIVQGQVERAPEQQLAARHRPGRRAAASARAVPGAAVPVRPCARRGRAARRGTGRRPKGPGEAGHRLLENRAIVGPREIDALPAQRDPRTRERSGQPSGHRVHHMARHRVPEARQPHLLQRIAVRHRPRRFRIREVCARGVREPEREGLLAFVDQIVQHRHRDRLLRLARRKGQGPGC